MALALKRHSVLPGFGLTLGLTLLYLTLIVLLVCLAAASAVEDADPAVAAVGGSVDRPPREAGVEGAAG